ncbi:MAG: peptidylprolyl isomerase, partial [Chitinophagia bacterium]|nr:peptidylprolyl isomerase [Chitinophagia bacterium]
IVAKCDTNHLGDSRAENGGIPVERMLDSTFNKSDFLAVVPYMSPGDSALIEISCDTIIATIPPNQQMQLPPWLKKGKKITINLSLVSVKSKADYENEQKAKASKQIEVDDKLLQDYFAANHLQPTKTASGLYYTIKSPGSGEAIQKGQTVKMTYTGKTLDGKVFDSNVEGANKGRDFSFPVGFGQVIPGWDEGVMLLKKGAKATFYIPSGLGYGSRAMPGLPANSNLIFDVEVVDVKAMQMEAK